MAFVGNADLRWIMIDEREDPRLRKVSHIGLWFFVICIAIWLVWSATHGRIKKENFSDNAKQTNTYHVTKNYALAFFDLAFFPFNIRGCSPVDKPDNIQQQATNEVVDAKQILNSVTSDDKP